LGAEVKGHHLTKARAILCSWVSSSGGVSWLYKTVSDEMIIFVYLMKRVGWFAYR
jgi:hypothetical protein